MHGRQIAERVTPQPTLERATRSLFSIGRSHRRHDIPSVCDVTASARQREWSLDGAQRAQLVATVRKWDSRKNGPGSRKPLPWLATGCRSMVRKGVDGSSPSEGFLKAPANALLSWADRTTFRSGDVHKTSTAPNVSDSAKA